MLKIRVYLRYHSEDSYDSTDVQQFYGEIEREALPQRAELLELKTNTGLIESYVLDGMSEFVGDEVYPHLYVWIREDFPTVKTKEEKE